MGFESEMSTGRKIAMNNPNNNTNSSLKSLHVCPTCYKTFTDISMLERHYLKNHTPLGNLGSMNTSYADYSYISNATTPTNTGFELSVGANTSVQLFNHLKSNSIDYVATNSTAGLSSKNSGTISRPDKSTSQLGKSFHKSEKLNRNVSNITKEVEVFGESSSHSCEICGKHIRRSENMKRHMLIHEDHNRPFPCSNCEKSFRQASHLKAHITAVHDEQGNLMCRICSKVFRHSKNFKRHMLIHEGIRPFSCVVCGKEFRQAVHLKTHLSTHDGKKPYSCSNCGKSFGRSANLKRHMLIHEGLKPFSCEICEKNFTQAGHLKNHILKCRDRRLFSSF